MEDRNNERTLSWQTIFAIFLIAFIGIFMIDHNISQLEKERMLNNIYANDVDIKLYKHNLELIANEKCNNKWYKTSYSSLDYRATIICTDNTFYNLDVKTVLGVVEK